MRLVAWALDAWLTTRMLIAGGAAIGQGLGQEAFDSLIEAHAERLRTLSRDPRTRRGTAAVARPGRAARAHPGAVPGAKRASTDGSGAVVADIRITDTIAIPAGELRVAFVRSGGPGGQNVNKVASKVQLRWTPATSAAFSEADRGWLLKKLASKLTSDGDLIVASNLTPDQGPQPRGRGSQAGRARHRRARAPEEAARDQTQPRRAGAARGREESARTD